MARTHQQKSLLPHNGAWHQLVKPRALCCIAQPGEGSGIAIFAARLLAGLATAAPHVLNVLGRRTVRELFSVDKRIVYRFVL